ncbi:unnamed protein product [Aphanomyces euteiches]
MVDIKFLCNMTNNNMETATQGRYQAYDDHLNRRCYDRHDEPRGFNNRPYCNGHPNADYYYPRGGRADRCVPPSPVSIDSKRPRLPRNTHPAEVLKSADAQAVAKVSVVGAQALLEVSKVVDMIAQEVVDEQATVNGDITAGDDNAAAPLDAVDPKQ